MSVLKGKTALVTGSGRGIGKALAKKLAKQGANVIVHDLDINPADRVVDTINKNGGQALAFYGDVTSDNFAQRVIDFMLENFGGIDIIVNNAGYVWNSSIQKTTNAQWDAMFACHVTAPFKILRAASSFIKSESTKEAKDGNYVFRKIVNVSSIAGFQGGATQVSYSSAKAAVVGLTKTLAKEWGKYRVNVNCVGFGLIETRLTDKWENETPNIIEIKGRNYKVGFQEQTRTELEKLIPLNRAGTAEEAAGALYLFCIPESDYITGQIISAGGGLISY